MLWRLRDVENLVGQNVPNTPTPADTVRERGRESERERERERGREGGRERRGTHLPTALSIQLIAVGIWDVTARTVTVLPAAP